MVLVQRQKKIQVDPESRGSVEQFEDYHAPEEFEVYHALKEFEVEK